MLQTFQGRLLPDGRFVDLDGNEIPLQVSTLPGQAMDDISDAASTEWDGPVVDVSNGNGSSSSSQSDNDPSTDTNNSSGNGTQAGDNEDNNSESQPPIQEPDHNKTYFDAYTGKSYKWNTVSKQFEEVW